MCIYMRERERESSFFEKREKPQKRCPQHHARNERHPSPSPPQKRRRGSLNVFFVPPNCLTAFSESFFPHNKTRYKDEMMMKKRTTRLSSSSSSLVVVIFGLFLFLSSSFYYTVAVAEEDPTSSSSSSSQLRSNSKCIDRGYDPNVVRCDYCRFALKDALGENDYQNQFVSECLECCKENDEDENDAFNGVKFDRATITACS